MKEFNTGNTILYRKYSRLFPGKCQDIWYDGISTTSTIILFHIILFFFIHVLTSYADLYENEKSGIYMKFWFLKFGYGLTQKYSFSGQTNVYLWQAWYIHKYYDFFPYFKTQFWDYYCEDVPKIFEGMNSIQGLLKIATLYQRNYDRKRKS